MPKFRMRETVKYGAAVFKKGEVYDVRDEPADFIPYWFGRQKVGVPVAEEVFARTDPRFPVTVAAAAPEPQPAAVAPAVDEADAADESEQGEDTGEAGETRGTHRRVSRRTTRQQ